MTSSQASEKRNTGIMRAKIAADARNWTPALGAARVMARCDALAARSDEPSQLTRLFLSPAMAEAHALVRGWMRAAGLTARLDGMGNLIGESAGHSGGSNAAEPLWVLGSHLDTVPNAGKYDGALGVIMAIEIVASLANQNLPFGFMVVGFSEEEGVRYRTPYLGSRALAGSFDAGWLELRDGADIPLWKALKEFNIDPEAYPSAALDAGRVVGYFEAHIEQGPVLEALGQPLGLVTAIAGQSRLGLRFAGQAGHAGTQPMNFRRDALTAASEWILLVESTARAHPGLVATVGTIATTPGVANVVAGEVTVTLDLRHADDDARESALTALLAGGREIARRRSVAFEVTRQATQKSVPMDGNLQQRLRAVLGTGAPSMASGAGHDAAVLAEVAPAVMLFLRTPGGLSHSPAENVNEADVAAALETMRAFFLLPENSTRN